MCSTLRPTGITGKTSMGKSGFIIMATIPFNLLKYTLNYIIAHLLYHRLTASVPKSGATADISSLM